MCNGVDEIKSEAIWKDFNFIKGLINDVKGLPPGDVRGLKEQAGVAVLEVLEHQAEIYASDAGYKNSKTRSLKMAVDMSVELFNERAHRFLWGYACAVTIEEMWQYFTATMFKEAGNDIIAIQWGTRNDPLQKKKIFALFKMARYDDITQNEWWKKGNRYERN